jgi:alpha-L-fucosidase
MKLTRRSAIGMMAGAAALQGHRGTRGAAVGGTADLPIAPGPFNGTLASLAEYETPEWFRDAKFGIWAHWGPQSAVENGDWYARNMYMQGSDQNKYHLEHYGHPSKVGYKDLIPNWHAAEWNPEHLVGLYKKAGAKYFFSMGVHHDNFDLWNSKYQRWNAANMGPKKDVVGLWQKAAQNHGLKFGVSEHLWITYKWFSVSHGHDDTGQFANVPYDGTNSKFWDLYTEDQTVYTELPWNEEGIPEKWKQHWFHRIKDLVDTYQPDLLYTDGALPFQEYGASAVANLYNLSARRNGGKTSAVYFSKRQEDCATGTCVLDVERGVVDNIWPAPWQTDTCIGDWHYKRGITYKRPKQVIDLLVDVVSRNGNLLLNFPLPNSGKLDDQEMSILSGITEWMHVNSEGIYATRPWKTFGNAPATTAEKGEAKFNEKSRKDLTADDVRFTTKGKTLYAFVMGTPDRQVSIPLLGTAAPEAAGKIENVTLLGYEGKLTWKQDAAALSTELPDKKPSEHAICLKVSLV